MNLAHCLDRGDHVTLAGLLLLKFSPNEPVVLTEDDAKALLASGRTVLTWKQDGADYVFEMKTTEEAERFKKEQA